MTYIIAVSKAGKNVLTETDPNSFIFHSSYNTFKILAQGTASHTIPASTTGSIKTIAHGKSFKPFVFIFIKWSDGKTGMLQTTKKGTSSGTANIYNAWASVNGTNIILNFDNLSGSSEAVTIAYLICEAPASS